MKKVSVNLNCPSYYVEPDSILYRFKRKLTLKPVLTIIKKIIGSRKKFSLLEIGTGSGFLLSFLESEFPQAALTGLEYDERLVAVTKQKVKKARIMQGNAEVFDFDNDKFDIIVSLQVIEHLYNPELMLASVRKHLAPGGTFILTSPNLSSYGARFMKDNWHGYREDHVSMKKFNEWVPFIQKNGFTPIYCGSTFLTGIPFFNKLPLGIINWGFLYFVGSMKWKYGESFVGIFKLTDNTDLGH
jgi:SAM-dependent methyltransferase